MTKIDDLAPAIRTAIRDTEDRSEVVISLVQLGLVVFLLTVYIISPKGITGAIFEPVPWFLGGYLPFALGRLFLALGRKLNPVLLNISIVIDMVLVLGVIWSFHIQYMQPSGFYLKAPTFVLLYVFIALRALRYDPKFVLFSGIFAALGWAGLTVYALLDYGERAANFTDYIMSTRILVGAQVEKIISLLAVTFILYFGTRKSQEILANSAQSSYAANQLGRFFSKQASQTILENGEGLKPGIGQVRDAVILTVDLRGFTKYAMDRDPRSVMTELAEYQSLMVPHILENGGVVDKFLGDGILATFGAANDSETCAADALRAIEGMIRDFQGWNAQRIAKNLPELGLGAAAAGGEVIFGAVGDAERLELTVIGHPVNLASKLEKANKTLSSTFLCTSEIYHKAEEQGYLPRIPYFTSTLKGLSGTRETLKVNGLRYEPVGFEGADG
jgi:adenylate cyclase